MKKHLLIGICFFILALPKFVLADAPPPPPVFLDVTYEGQKITDEKFYAVILTCQSSAQDLSRSNNFSDGFNNRYDELKNKAQQSDREFVALDKLNITENNPANNCTWKPSMIPISQSCSNSQCHFGWILGNFKAAVYLPGIDKVFISNQLSRKYEGHYGFDTPRNYAVKLSKDGGAIMAAEIGMFDDPSISPAGSDNQPHPDMNDPSRDTGLMAKVGLSLQIIISLIVTLFVELIVVLIFALVKKFPKKILLATIIGNVVSLPLLWILVFKWYQMLYPGEILVVIFEAWIIKLLLKEKINWKWCLIISLVANIASFIFGPRLLF